MTTDEIAHLPVGEMANARAHLYLWSTRRAFREGDAVRVARAWGFEPVGELIWGLRNPGTGSGITLNGHEPILLASRGRLPFPDTESRTGGVYFWRQVYEYGPAGVPQKVHSAKPPALQDLAEQISPAPRVELFARAARLGWDSWGDQSLETASMPSMNPRRSNR